MTARPNPSGDGCRNRRLRAFRLGLVVVLLALSGAVRAQSRPDIPATSPSLDRIVPLEATVNGVNTGTWPFVERQGTLYASREALDEWRLRLQPDARPIEVRGVQYWPLATIPGFTAKPNYAAQAVEFTFAPEAFTATRVATQAPEKPRVSPVLPSLFANYELNYSQSHVRSAGTSSDLGALVELGGSTQLGVLTSSHLGRNLAQSAGNRAEWTRLETTFTHDFPEHNVTFRAGDSSTRAGQWGRAVYFGGLQLGTNYTLTPGFLTQPVPVIAGTSRAPSTVELYVNDVLRQVAQVPAGPFAIDNVGALTGTGEARLVVRDILGREVVLTQPFFSNASLLKAGLADWGVDIGALRQDLGQRNSRYGQGFANGTARYGLSNTLTAEARLELRRDVQTAGLSIVSALPFGLLGRGTLAASQEDGVATGSRWIAGLERQWTTSAVRIQYEAATRSFRMLGLSGTALPVRSQWTLNATHTWAGFGSFGIALVSLQPWDNPAITTLSLNHAIRIGLQATLTTFVSRAYTSAVGATGGTAVGVTLQVPLESNRQVTASAQVRGGQTDAYLTASRTAMIESDLGWRVLGGQLGNEGHAEAGLYYQGRRGNLYSDISASPRQVSMRAGATGGVVFTAGELFATRRLEQSFALVEVKGYEGIGVGVGTNAVAKTDRNGRALVPNLTAYTQNQIRLNPQDLPISAELQSIEEIVVPPLRSAVRIEFPVRAGRAALLRIQFDDGEPAPPGAVVRSPKGEEFWVARRGEAFVTGLESTNTLELVWKDKRCTMKVDLPPASPDDIPRVPVRCGGISR